MKDTRKVRHHELTDGHRIVVISIDEVLLFLVYLFGLLIGGFICLGVSLTVIFVGAKYSHEHKLKTRRMIDRN